MHCEKFEARLNTLLDERLRPECDAALQDHAESCEACRETLALSEYLFSGLELHELPAVSDHFAEDVIARVLADTPRVGLASRDNSRGPVIRLLSSALAASLLIAALAVAAQFGGQSVSQMPVVPANASSEGEVGRGSDDPPGPDIRMAAAPSLDSLQAGTISINADEFVMFYESADGLLDARNTGRMIREVTASLPEVPVVDERIPGLRPLTQSVSLTLGVVRKTFPGGRETPRDDTKRPAPSKPQAEFSREHLRHLA